MSGRGSGINRGRGSGRGGRGGQAHDKGQGSGRGGRGGQAHDKGQGSGRGDCGGQAHDRGRGRGRGGHGGQAHAIKNLERTTADIQNMLQKMVVSGNKDPGHSPTTKKKPDSRGSTPVVGISISVKGAPQWRGPPHRGRHQSAPRCQNPQYAGSPNRGHYKQNPSRQDHYRHSSPGHGPYPGQHYHESPQYPPAPPSYDESVRQYVGGHPQYPIQSEPEGSRKGSEQRAAKPAEVQQLVKALAMFDGQMADVEALSRQVESTTEEVEKTVKQRKDLFAYLKDGRKIVVELVPNVKLCSYYQSENGCTSRDSCQALHLCKDYILARCDQGPTCTYGHKCDTNHNSSVLSKLYLDLLKTQHLVSVIRKVCRGNAPPKICSYYSTEKGCRHGDNCRFLHICKDYVINDGNCSTKGCSFNHQLNVKQCRNVLTQHGMSANESARDILLALKSSVGSTSDNQPSSAGGKIKNQGETVSTDEDSSDSDSSVEVTDTSVKKKKNKVEGKKRDKSSKGEKSKGKKQTIKSTDFYGDVEIPEICIYGVNDKCTNESKGCKYLHAKSLFHWQVEKENKWYNLRIFQSKTLESAYRDVSQGDVRLPSIDAEKLSPYDQQILQILGTHSWTADFKEMCITDPAKNKLNIRRVSTASSVVSSFPQATVFQWYFEDEQGKWIRYGDVDSLGKENYVCSITSEDIEKQYLSDPSSTMFISNPQFKYKIDFKSMTQTNQSSMKMREIRRRPSRLSYQKGNSSNTNDPALPAHWQSMSSKQTHILVTVDPNQEEFQDVSKSIKLMIPTAKIHEVRRLQNEYLYRLLQNKKADLSSRYDDLTMNVQKLFHGSDPAYIDSICKENIDGRRYDNTKEKYGKGTYFSNSCAIARTYCTPDAEGHLFLILAEVIIGYVTVGSKSFNRPPPNASTGYPYDTTVDSVTAPTVFVKYDKDEYYPEYIIEISV